MVYDWDAVANVGACLYHASCIMVM
jgi:hypothetical protein